MLLSHTQKAEVTPLSGSWITVSLRLINVQSECDSTWLCMEHESGGMLVVDTAAETIARH